ncbi:hypothetical protein QQ045_011730 [Rhodiola kirilowii]
MDADDIIHPSSIDNSVLRQQSTHHTEAIWNSQLDPKGKANIPFMIYKGGALPLDHRILHYLVAAGFYPWTQVCDVKNDPSLLIAVIERWRPETHTFHFNEGEATITLQNVSLLTGFPVEEETLTGKSQLNFNEISIDADDETLKKYARAYLLNLIGSTLFSDKSGKTIPLYFLPLKGVRPKRWVGVPHGSLLQYRDAIQKMQPGDFVWRSYYYTLFELLNPIYLKGQQTTWRADVPLIYYNIVEWHHTARVARYYIALWVTHHERFIDGDMGDPHANIAEPTLHYFTWYSRHTHRLYQSRIDDDVEEVGDEDVQETHHSYRPDSHMIPDHLILISKERRIHMLKTRPMISTNLLALHSKK